MVRPCSPRGFRRPAHSRSRIPIKLASPFARLAQSGVDFLKVYNSIPRDAYFALAEEARAIGIPFAGHVPEAVSPLEASNAGQRSQEHLINLLLACSTDEEKLRTQRIELMLSQQISGEARMRELAFPNPAGLFEIV